jgi:hypothetical protein
VPRVLVVLVLVLASCRTLLGIEEGVVGDPTADGALPDADADAPPGDAPCTGAGCTCRQSSDCSSQACLSGAVCADSNNVAYVSPQGGGSTCTMALPCATLTAGLAAGKPYIKVSGHVMNQSTAVISSARVILGDDHTSSTVTLDGDGPVIEVMDGASLEIRDVGIHGASEGNAHGISMMNGATARIDVIGCRIYDNEGAGIATELGTINIDRTTIANNLGAGLSFDASSFKVTNSIIVRNGTILSLAGGAILDPAGVSTFDNNTVYDNVSMPVGGQSVNLHCFSNFTVENNIIGGRVTGCSPRYSLLDMQQGSATNFTGPTMFVQTNSMTSSGYYRIAPTSAAIDRGTQLPIMVDIDNETRPADAIDVGADEYVP